MSSKLKAKPRKQRLPLAQPNQAAQAFGRAMINCHSQIKSMEREAYENGFNDGEDWADTINVVTTMMALRRLYGVYMAFLRNVCSQSCKLPTNTSKWQIGAK